MAQMMDEGPFALCLIASLTWTGDAEEMRDRDAGDAGQTGIYASGIYASGTCEKILLGCEAGSRIETGCALVRCKLNVREVESTASSRGNSQHILAHRSMKESTRL